MADDGDIAQDYYEKFAAHRMEEHKRAQEKRLQNLPRCENFIDCKSKVFVTEKGTVARYCKDCWEEILADRAA